MERGTVSPGRYQDAVTAEETATCTNRVHGRILQVPGDPVQAGACLAGNLAHHIAVTIAHQQEDLGRRFTQLGLDLLPRRVANRLAVLFQFGVGCLTLCLRALEAILQIIGQRRAKIRVGRHKAGRHRPNRYA